MAELLKNIQMTNECSSVAVQPVQKIYLSTCTSCVNTPIRYMPKLSPHTSLVNASGNGRLSDGVDEREGD